MTEKQERILRAGLQLFATQGYYSTSTNKVAKEAGVSEGLIFRHFGNKEGLLNAILEMSKESAKQAMSEVVLSDEPEDAIRKMLELPFRIKPEEYEMWRLTYALKWQTDSYKPSYQDPVKLILKNAFEKLGYQNPQAEVELIFMFIDGAATSLLLHQPEDKIAVLESLKSKYKV